MGDSNFFNLFNDEPAIPKLQCIGGNNRREKRDSC